MSPTACARSFAASTRFMRPLTSPSGNALGYGQRPMGSALEAAPTRFVRPLTCPSLLWATPWAMGSALWAAPWREVALSVAPSGTEHPSGQPHRGLVATTVCRLATVGGSYIPSPEPMYISWRPLRDDAQT